MSTSIRNQAVAIPSELDDLVNYLDSLNERADVEQLGRLLSENVATIEVLNEFVQFGKLTYRRNLIKQNDWYELLCICWRSGQRSPDS